MKHETTEFPRMLKMLDFGADILADTDIEVFNCSPDPTLQSFKKTSYSEALAY